jgi:hypothetical protein
VTKAGIETQDTITIIQVHPGISRILFWLSPNLNGKNA